MSAYITHLAQVNEIQPVYTRNIVTATDNTPVLDQGVVLDHAAAERLKQYALARPIEHSIALEGEFTVELLFELLLQSVDSDPSFTSIQQQRPLGDKLLACTQAFCEQPILLQKLNVLAIQLPDIFDQSLFCAWMSICVLAHENFSQARLNNAFIAALSHDLGLLDVSPDILFKTAPLDPEQWQAMQQHPLLGARLLKEKCLGIDKETIRAVAEHHETPDGTGYPRGRFEKQLGDLGRMLYMLDSVNAIYRKHFIPRARSLHDVVPIIQMTTLSCSGVFGATLVKIMRLTSKTEHCAIEAALISPTIALIQQNAQEIQQFSDLTASFSLKVGVGHKDLGVLSLQNIAKMIRASVSSCGIINEAYMRWLELVDYEKLEFAYRELEDVLLMTQEVKFHMLRYQRQIDAYLAQAKPSPLSTEVQALKTSLNDIYSGSTAPQALIDYLNGT